MNEKIIKLKIPVPLPEKKGEPRAFINEVRIGRVKAKHYKLLPKKFYESDGKDMLPHEMYPFVAGLTGLSVDIIGEIDGNDINELITVAVSFLAQSQETGNKSSGE